MQVVHTHTCISIIKHIRVHKKSVYTLSAISLVVFGAVAQPGFGSGEGTGGLGNGGPQRSPGTEPLVGGSEGIASRKFIAFGCQTMHNFVYLAQRHSQKFSCKPNFFLGGGRAPAPWLRHCFGVKQSKDKDASVLLDNQIALS